MNHINTTIAVISLTLFFVVLYLVFRKNTKWKCTESGCKYEFGGKHENKLDCEKSCLKKENELEEPKAWACSSSGFCTPADSGFTDRDLCEQNCGNKYSYYYPQTLLYYPGRFRPRYWRYRRRQRRRP